MNPIAIFFHSRLSGGDPPINADHAVGIMASQMDALTASGLAEAADHFVIGSNGDTFNHMAAVAMAPKNATVVAHGHDARSELPTLALLRKWLPGHEDWFVLYHHTKGAGHWNHGQFFAHTWRQCMEHVVVWNWRLCVNDLKNGYDAVGAHWLTREKYGATMGATLTPYFGGTFWWAKASFLATLPAILDNARAGNTEDRYLAEKWIGLGRIPRVRDYAPHWPGKNCHNSYELPK